MSDFLLYTLGLRDQMELDDMIKAFASEEEIKTPSSLGTYTYKDILNKKFKLVNQADYYEYDSQYKVWKDKSDNAEYMKNWWQTERILRLSESCSRQKVRRQLH